MLAVACGKCDLALDVSHGSAAISVNLNDVLARHLAHAA